SFQRLHRVTVGRKAGIFFSSSCVLTTCSWRLRVHAANQRSGGLVNGSVRRLVRRRRFLSRLLVRRGRRLGLRRRQLRDPGFPDLLQLFVPPLDDRLRAQLGHVLLG